MSKANGQEYILRCFARPSLALSTAEMKCIIIYKGWQRAALMRLLSTMNTHYNMPEYV